MNTQLVEFDQLKADVTLFVTPTLQLIVGSIADASRTIEAGKAIKDLLKKIDAKRTEMVRPLNDRVKEINSYAKDISDPLLKAEQHIKSQLAAFEIEQEKKRQEELLKLEEKRREEERRIQEEQKKRTDELRAKQEIERKKAEEEARAEAEAAELFGPSAVDEAALKKAEEDRKRIHEEQERMRLAEEARIERERIEREKKTAQERSQIEAQRVKNMKEIWKYRVLNMAAVPRELLILDDVKVGAMVRGGARQIPGLEIYSEKVIALGRGTSIAAL